MQLLQVMNLIEPLSAEVKTGCLTENLDHVCEETGLFDNLIERVSQFNQEINKPSADDKADDDDPVLFYQPFFPGLLLPNQAPFNSPSAEASKEPSLSAKEALSDGNVFADPDNGLDEVFLNKHSSHDPSHLKHEEGPQTVDESFSDTTLFANAEDRLDDIPWAAAIKTTLDMQSPMAEKHPVDDPSLIQTPFVIAPPTVAEKTETTASTLLKEASLTHASKEPLMDEASELVIFHRPSGLHGEKQSASLSLHPHHLGEIRANIETSQDGSSVTFIAQTQQANELIHANMPHLKHLFTEANLDISTSLIQQGFQENHSENQEKKRTFHHMNRDENDKKYTLARSVTASRVVSLIDTYA